MVLFVTIAVTNSIANFLPFCESNIQLVSVPTRISPGTAKDNIMTDKPWQEVAAAG